MSIESPLARGRQAEVFDQHDGTVLKLFHDPSASDAAAREALVLRKVATSGLRVPHVVDQVLLEGRPGIVMERIDEADWLTRLGVRPWEALVIGRRLASAHLALHAVNAPSGVPSSVDLLRHRLESSDSLEPATRSAMLDKLSQLEESSRKLCHGDFHLENVLGALRAPVVIDWGSASAGPPVGDVARTNTVLSFGEPPDGAPLVVRKLAAVARGRIVSSYLATYDRRQPGSLARLDEWQLVHAASRIGETTATESSAIASWLASRVAANS